ncbi:MAG: ABC transporter ATP-binding protein [Ruminococcus sp.]|nr:ABC transporter ATP-binding protein [Ruminococcus sp.]
MTHTLEVRNLTKKYERFTLDNVSFDLPMGCIMGVVGENGAGKSTLFKAILNLIHRNAGEILFWGKPMTDKDTKMREQIGVAFDAICFSEVLTVKQVGNIGKYTYKNWDSAQFQELVTRFELPLKAEIKTLSKGMKMKLNLAFAMSHNAKLLILDEPTAGLDPIARDELLDLFLDFVQDEEHSILISSHITTDLEKIADYITFINKGKLAFTKEKDTLLYQYGIVRCGEKDLDAVKNAGCIAWKKNECNYDVLVEDREAMKRTFPHLVIDNATIDEIMLLTVKGERV